MQITKCALQFNSIKFQLVKSPQMHHKNYAHPITGWPHTYLFNRIRINLCENSLRVFVAQVYANSNAHTHSHTYICIWEEKGSNKLPKLCNWIEKWKAKRHTKPPKTVWAPLLSGGLMWEGRGADEVRQVSKASALDANRKGWRVTKVAFK